MISIENLSKSYGGHVLFNGITFKINSKEKIGLVGRNGHGKSTLVRIISGRESIDSGNVIIPKNYRIGYVEQSIHFTENTILKEGMKGLLTAEKDHYWQVEKILTGLGFSEEDMQRHPMEFSGGFQVRLNLAKVLVSDPDMLLLDEPTNYLDISSIRWVEQFLNAWPHALLLITHDRSFMDKVVTHILGIHRKKIRKITGNTEKYYDQMAQEEEIIEKTRQNIQRREKEIHRFISRFRAKARLANLVQSRIKSLEKMDKGKKLEKIKTLDFCFRSKPFKGKYVLSAKKLSFSYTPEKRFIDNFDMTVSSGQRICLIGKNGKGKTTLLKLLAQQLEPESGEVLYNPQTTAGFFEQTNIKSLVDTRTVLEEILFAHTDVDQQIARDICGAMLFEGEASLKKIQILSGGEKSRVMLGKLLVTPVNLLLLDEPTNHLDMESCDALLAAIDAFEGTVIMVTHNEMFLHALADRLVIFRDEGIDMFEGSYGRFLNERGWNDDEKTCLKDGMQTEQKNSDKLTKKEIRRRRSEIITQRSKLLNPMENRIAEIENAIDAKEKEVEAFNHAMMDASLDNNGKKIGELSKNINQCETAIEKYFQELELLSETYEEKKEKFDKQLENLEQPDSYSAGS